MRPKIKNRKARFNYEILDTYEAGIVLKGTEVKSLRQGKASIKDAFAYFKNGELFLKNMHIAPYDQGSVFNHDPWRERKLLLHKDELRKLYGKIREKGFALIPLEVYFNKRNIAKVKLALAKGKKKYDKREAIKKKDLQREMQRIRKLKL